MQRFTQILIVTLGILAFVQLTQGAKPKEIQRKVREWSESIPQTNLSLDELSDGFELENTETLVLVCETSGNMKTPVGDGRLLATSFVAQSLVNKYTSISQLIVFDGDGNMVAKYKNSKPFNDQQKNFLKGRIEEFMDYEYRSGRSSLMGILRAIEFLENQNTNCSLVLIGDSIYNKTDEEKNASAEIINKVGTTENLRVSSIYIEFIPFDPPKRKKGSLRHEYSLENEFYLHNRTFIEKSIEITNATGGEFVRVSIERDFNPSEKYTDLVSDDRYPTFTLIKNK